jgi:hypothetical protein
MNEQDKTKNAGGKTTVTIFRFAAITRGGKEITPEAIVSRFRRLLAEAEANEEREKKNKGSLSVTTRCSATKGGRTRHRCFTRKVW